MIERQIENTAEHHKREKEKKVEWKKNILSDIIKRLDALYELPNSMDKIINYIAVLRSLKEHLGEYKDIPNYEKLKETFKGSDEAVILNIAYKIYVLSEYREAEKMLGKLSKSKNDIRVPLMKLRCQEYLHKPDTELVKTLGEVLNIDPLHEQSIMQKGALEAKIKAKKQNQ